MKSTLSKEIVFTYFSGRATSLQKKLIRSWLSEPGSGELYYEWLEEWEKNHPHFLADVNTAWEKNWQSLNQSNSEELLLKSSQKHKTYKNAFPRLVFWRVAACVIIAGVGLYFAGSLVLYRHYSTSYAELRTIVLEDNSVVVLNANSKLRVPRWGFGQRRRDVYLEGEAEFNVKKTSDQVTFTVHTDDRNKVTVLGTEFVVYSRDRGTRVILNKGKIELTPGGEAQSPLIMTPGEEAQISRDGQVKIEKLTENQLEANMAWKEHRFVFDRTPLSEVSTRLTEIFGVVIRISDSTLLKRELSGSFPAQNLDEILDVLSEILEIEIERKNKILVFKLQHTSETL